MDTLDRPAGNVVVRNLRPSDLEAVIRIDAKNVGRRRDEFFRLKLKQALSDTAVTVSLAAELEGAFVGFLMARVFYGEFGVTERVAVMDVIDVHPDFRGHHVAAALLDQLRTNLLGLGIQVLGPRWAGTAPSSSASSAARVSSWRSGSVSISPSRPCGASVFESEGQRRR